MIPYPYDITLDKGSTFQLEFYVLGDDNITPFYFNGTNMTKEYSCRMQVRRSYLSDNSLVNLSTIPTTDQYVEDSIIFDELEDGLIKIQISATTTKNLPPGKHFYDIELEDEDGIVKKLLKGRIEIVGEVSR